DRMQDFTSAEIEHPDLVAIVIPNSEGFDTISLATSTITKLAQQSQWQGQANCLSTEHREWPIIDKVAHASIKPTTKLANALKPKPPTKFSNLFLEAPNNLSAQQIIFQRRSAVSFDGHTEITALDFYRVLARTMPSNNAPWDGITWPSNIHLCLFVHRVCELLPGLYILVRDKEKVSILTQEMKSDFVKTPFLWQKPPFCPDELPLYFLLEGNCQVLASQVSCGQDIAGDSAFSLGMIAEFELPIREFGAWYYRRLFWETGVIGQILYLEAEAMGVRATGIGCFFDDPVHEIFGFKNRKYQSLYHFTLGGTIEDKRLTTLPAYSQEIKAQR
ncbi:MAG: hypothetical protein FD167_1957, partial [bacterium]